MTVRIVAKSKAFTKAMITLPSMIVVDVNCSAYNKLTKTPTGNVMKFGGTKLYNPFQHKSSPKQSISLLRL